VNGVGVVGGGRAVCGWGRQGCQVLVAGVQPPLNTPLAWLHAKLAAADQFLYVVVLTEEVQKKG
jgi:hypothetical protein